MYTIYLIHFDKPYWKNCKHYLGYTKNLKERLRKHISGNGSKLVDYALKNGSKITYIQVLNKNILHKKEARKLEIKLKKNNYKKFCNRCQFIKDSISRFGY